MPTLDWLNRAAAFTITEQVPYRLLEQVSIHTATARLTLFPIRPEPVEGSAAATSSAPTQDHSGRSAIHDNLLIRGDNLEALKALLPFYRGQVKCIFIDPPYNTRSAFEHYDDNLEHAQWLSMMLPRLQLLRELLREDGSIWVTIDDNEGHYLKVLVLHAKVAPVETPLVVYGESVRIGPKRLAAAGVTFKQIPYDVRAR